jgi:hypothetical protein
MRSAFVALAFAAAIWFAPSPASAQWYGGYPTCWGVCCGSVVKSRVTYRKVYRYVRPRTVARRDRLDGFIPEIAMRRAACCAYFGHP